MKLEDVTAEDVEWLAAEVLRLEKERDSLYRRIMNLQPNAAGGGRLDDADLVERAGALWLRGCECSHGCGCCGETCPEHYALMEEQDRRWIGE